MLHISIHTPARGVTRSINTTRRMLCNFNPHSRKGSDDRRKRQFENTRISIHTPARGVTYSIEFMEDCYRISIHTPARGVTRYAADTQGKRRISIHTPARGVTYAWCIFDWHLQFQSTLPQGEWPPLRKSSNITSISIHTPARGVTTTAAILFPCYVFQSTLPQGEWRIDVFHALCITRISIHTPARGVTVRSADRHLIFPISIHTPARGVTGQWRTSTPHTAISIHTPARGVTLWSCPSRYGDSIFQSTLPQGEWQTGSINLYLTLDFNPHSRKGSDEDTTQQILAKLQISIHTPARGVTKRIRRHLTWNNISIHTPARGVTAIFTNNYISILSLSSKVTFQNHL